MNVQFDKRLVEPNSALGGALRYLLNHWSGLTLFLRKAGPLWITILANGGSSGRFFTERIRCSARPATGPRWAMST